MTEDTMRIELTVPSRIKSKHPIKVTVETKDPQELLMITHNNLAYMEQRYGLKPEILFRVGDAGDVL